MRFELGLEEPEPRRARISTALTIAASYIAGAGAVGPLFLPAACAYRPGRVGGHHPARSPGFWLYQGKIHYPSASSKCLANGRRGGIGRRRRFPPRQVLWIGHALSGKPLAPASGERGWG